jgi:hypothetical protein
MKKELREVEKRENPLNLQMTFHHLLNSTRAPAVNQNSVGAPTVFPKKRRHAHGISGKA